MSTFWQLTRSGGPITGLIFVLGFVCLVIVIDRLLHFHRAQINAPEFMRGLFNVLRRGNAAEAVSICDEAPGPIARLLRSAILRAGAGEEEMHRAIQEAALSEVPRLERHLKLLATLAGLAPLLGFLGTVVGMITLFQSIQEGGVYVETRTLAQGIWQALISTAAGLTVAISAHGFYNFFVSRLDNMLVEMEKSSMEMIHFLLHCEVTADPQSAPPAEETAGEA